MTFLAVGLKLVADKAATRIHARQLTMAATAKKRQWRMAARRLRVTTDAKARRVTRAARLAIKRRVTTVNLLGKSQGLMGAWAHGAMATGALIHRRIDKPQMTRVAQTIRRPSLMVMKAGKSGVVHEVRGNRMRGRGTHIRS